MNDSLKPAGQASCGILEQHRVFALTAMDRVIPNFTSLAETLTQTPAGRERPRPPAQRRRCRAADQPARPGANR
jgi:hypothetical protein